MLPQEFHVKRQIVGNPLEGMPILPVHPPEFTPGERYTQERKDIIDKNHPEGFLWVEERKLLHELIKSQEMAFAWNAAEGGNFRTDFFPLVKFPVLPHVLWVERDIPIPPGIYKEVCRIIKDKIDAGVYEPSSSSYQSKWFCIPSVTAEVASHFSGRACIGLLDIWVGYDERLIDEESRDLTTFQTLFGPHQLVKLPMGWTNLVPIFHNDVCCIFRDEIPEITMPYVDDVLARGPASQYKLEDGLYQRTQELEDLYGNI
ncbi:gag-pol polyprotein [Moniliophthora roreri MCA 2997]|uniref:Gag-pol polyprotein n=1 Tax=Moniliophthora roreri (strain MCA 2997) TaxID=1381753 RepID=V2W531_MONRO|nr:gag-pol polyprotein [Moniliophthora roreri MCA 2997]